MILKWFWSSCYKLAVVSLGTVPSPRSSGMLLELHSYLLSWTVISQHLDFLSLSQYHPGSCNHLPCNWVVVEITCGMREVATSHAMWEVSTSHCVTLISPIIREERKCCVSPCIKEKIVLVFVYSEFLLACLWMFPPSNWWSYHVKFQLFLIFGFIVLARICCLHPDFGSPFLILLYTYCSG